MKIEFLNPEMTHARLTRGFWWWRRMALVHETKQTFKWDPAPHDVSVSYEYWRHWVFNDTGREIGEQISAQIQKARTRQRAAEKEAELAPREWVKVQSLPEAVARVRAEEAP